MDNSINKKIYALAEKISKAGKYIAKDEIGKDYYIGCSDLSFEGGIIVTSDSGYEAIYIGDIRSGSTNGYMCLYTNNTPKRNSFPSAAETAELLQKVPNCERLPEGEGKAAYYNQEEYGGIEKQLKYFSEVVKRIAGIK